MRHLGASGHYDRQFQWVTDYLEPWHGRDIRFVHLEMSVIFIAAIVMPGI